MIKKYLNHIANLTNGKQLMFIYIGIIALLINGLLLTSGYKYIEYILLHSTAFILFFIGINKLLKSGKIKLLKNTLNWQLNLKTLNTLAILILGITIFFIAFQFILLDHLPIIKCFKQTDIYNAALVRQNVTRDTPFYINYATSFSIKAIFPFLLVLFFFQNKKQLFIITLLLAWFYVLNMLQKSYYVFILLPLILFCLLNKKYVFTILFSFFLLLGIAVLVYITNPQLRGHGQDRTITAGQGIEAGSNAILHRVLVTPGKVVSIWFELIPSQYPFLNGCGYKQIAMLKKCNYVNYSTVIYDAYYPQYTKLGLHGSLNVASFMREYSNFGLWGLVLAALFLAVWLNLVQLLFYDQIKLLFIFNFYPICMLSSGSLFTLLISGGWVLTIVLYFVFKPSLLQVSPTK